MPGSLTGLGGASGILLGSNSTVTHNTATGNGLNGISADQRSLVTSNTANDNGRNGIVVDARTTVSFNTANNSDDGIEAFCPATITHNTASGNDGLDIKPIGTGCVIQNNNTTPPSPSAP